MALIFLQGAASPYLAAATVAPLLLLAAIRTVSAPRTGSGPRLLGTIVAASLLLFLLYLPHAALQLSDPGLLDRSPWSRVGTGGARFGALPMRFPESLRSMTHPHNAAMPMVWLIVAGAITRLLRRRSPSPVASDAWRHGLLWTIAGLLISIPPVIFWFGERVTLP